MLNRLFILLIGIAFVGCGNSKSEFDMFFVKVDKALSNEEKSILKECADVRCIMGFVFSNSNEKLNQLFDSIPINITNILDSAEVKQPHYLFLLSMYNKKRNDKVFSFQEIEREIEVYHQNQKKDSDQWIRKNNDRLTRIAELNYEKINIGDTICLEFPLEIHNNMYEASYSMPSVNDDLVTLTFVVLEKECIPIQEQFEFSTPEFNLQLKIIKSTHFPCTFGVDKINMGDEFSLGIFHYGREINLCTLDGPVALI